VACRLDCGKRACSTTRFALGEVRGDACLHVDRGQRVRDHVVQLTRDPQPFLLGAPLRLLFASALREFELFDKKLDVGATVAERFRGQHRDGDERHMRSGLQRERVCIMSGEEDVGDHHRGRCRDHGGDQVDATARERERVERDRRCDHRNRARSVVDCKEGEHERAGDGDRRGRSAAAQHQDRGCCECQRQRKRARRRVSAHSDSDHDDHARDEQHGGVEQVTDVALHAANLARLDAAHVLRREYPSYSSRQTRACPRTASIDRGCTLNRQENWRANARCRWLSWRSPQKARRSSAAER
jgi:hypothetical protein